MNEQELQKLRDILFERLLCDEDPAALHAQLARRVGADQAEQMIAETRQRIEARSGDPKFAQSIEDIRKRRDASGGYWRGPIASRRQAERIARITAGWVGGFGALALLSSLSTGRLDASMLTTGLLFIIPAMALWKTKSVIAAGCLVGVIGLGCVSLLVFMIFSVVIDGSLGAVGGVVGLVLLGVWLIPLLATLRALSATRFLRRETAASPLIAVFD